MTRQHSRVHKVEKKKIIMNFTKNYKDFEPPENVEN
jgi:hypothetical protein